MNYIYTIGELREAIKDFKDEDEIVVEVHEGTRGEDLYTPYIDVVKNVETIGGNFIDEIRLCI